MESSRDCISGDGYLGVYIHSNLSVYKFKMGTFNYIGKKKLE
jgi:hypothetical protein